MGDLPENVMARPLFGGRNGRHAKRITVARKSGHLVPEATGSRADCPYDYIVAPLGHLKAKPSVAPQALTPPICRTDRICAPGKHARIAVEPVSAASSTAARLVTFTATNAPQARGLSY